MLDLIAGELVLVVQLIVALAFGMALGTERTLSHKTAGMRTYGLVALGSCLFIIISEVVTASYIGIASDGPLRVAAAIVTGIGFLGAGVILFRKDHLTGLTSAAGLWVAAGIGIAVGYQLFLVAVTATILTLITFSILWRFEQKLQHTFDEEGKVNHNLDPFE